MIFSLQGACAETHDSITHYPSSFQRTLSAIEQAKAQGVWTGIHFVPMRPNVNELSELVELCSSRRVDEIGILRFVPQGNGKLNRSKLELSKEAFNRLLHSIIYIRAQFHDVYIRTGCPLNFAALIMHSPVQSCKAGRSTCVIKPNGDVVPCPAFKQDSGRVMGNVLRESLINIWNQSPGWTEFRSFSPTRLNEPCGSCSSLNSCAGRCAAQRILNFGSIYSSPDPMCPLEAPCETRKALV